MSKCIWQVHSDTLGCLRADSENQPVTDRIQGSVPFEATVTVPTGEPVPNELGDGLAKATLQFLRQRYRRFGLDRDIAIVRCEDE